MPSPCPVYLLYLFRTNLDTNLKDDLLNQLSSPYNLWLNPVYQRLSGYDYPEELPENLEELLDQDQDLDQEDQELSSPGEDAGEVGQQIVFNLKLLEHT